MPLLVSPSLSAHASTPTSRSWAATGEGAEVRLVERVPAAVYTARGGPGAGWLYVSPQIESLLGFTPDEVVTDPLLWSRQLHPDDRDWVMHGDATGDPSNSQRAYAEYRMLRRDGSVVWVLDDVTLVHDPEHGVLQHGLLYDITGRKSTELLLAEQADIVERVARGEDLVETLQAIARATRFLTGARDCTLVVHPGAGGPDGFVVNPQGVVATEDGARGGGHTAVPFHCNGGEPLGHLVLHLPQAHKAAPNPAESEAINWATRLAALAVGRAQQDAQTRTSFSLLRATLESTADGILVVDASGKVAGNNEKFRQMWRIPQDLMASGDDERIMGYVLDQLVDPGAFVAEVQRLYHSPDLSTFDSLDFRDGRVFERYSQPQLLDGKSVGRVWSFRDVTAYRHLENELRQQANTDPLTGLPNRALVMERLTAALARREANGEGRNVGLLLLDVDDFKTINDSLGHVAGDALLLHVANQLKACIRADDTAARLGGDEFVVLLENLADTDQASALAERILAALSEPMDLEGRGVTVRASIGIAAAAPGMGPGELVRNADLAMYTAKRDGGARHRRYACAMHTDAMSRLDLQADLSRAIDRGELTVDYQPVVAVDSRELRGVEALLRWHHPQRGPVSPAEFIPLAEDTGLINTLGRWVLERACAEASRWHRLWGEQNAPTVSVNLSPRQLADPALVDEIRGVLAKTRLPGSALCLEITEGALLQSGVDVLQVLAEIKSLGVQLALDDFGTGHSSLGRLDLYPLDIIKVDRSFVSRLEDPRSAALVEAILRLASALDLDVVAEGVETEQQLQALTHLGCPNGQGFLFATPASPGQICDLLTSDPALVPETERGTEANMQARQDQAGNRRPQPSTTQRRSDAAPVS